LANKNLKISLIYHHKNTFMENVYQSYTKTIQNTTYYFVKKFMVFPEIKDLPPVLESYGMHSNFDKACRIAQIEEDAVKKQLLNEIQRNTCRAKVIDLRDVNFISQKAANQ